MKIFQDIFNDQELLSDSYKIEELFGGVIGQVKSRMVVKKEGQVDIGCGNAFGGNNQQQEGGSGGNGQAPPEKVIDLVDAFQYVEIGYDKDGFKSYFTTYMKKLLEWLQKNKPDRVQPFKAGAKEFFKWALANCGQFTYWAPSNYDTENLLVFSYYKNEQDEAPTFLYVMDGFKFYKV